jgi:hypothetical protein
MPLDAMNKSRLEASQRAERDDLADKHADQQRQLAEQHNAAAAREKAANHKRLNTPSRGYGDHSSVRTTDFKAKHAEALSELKSKQRGEYEDLRSRHKKETAEAEKTGNTHRVVSREAAKINSMGVPPKEAAEYRQTLAKHQNQHSTQHNIDESKRDRLDRYKSASMTAAMENARLSKHDEISRRHERELASLRRRIQARQRVA